MSIHDASSSPSRWVLRFSGLVADGARVLDVGCGQGRHSRWFAARGCHVVAVDRDQALLVGGGRPGRDDAAVERTETPAAPRDHAIAGVRDAGVDAEDHHPNVILRSAPDASRPPAARPRPND